MSLLDTVARFVAETGETMTLRRKGATPLPLKGKRILGTIEDVGGSARQQRFKVKIGVAELQGSAWSPAKPVAGADTIDVSGRPRTILSVHELSGGDTVALYELEVIG